MAGDPKTKLERSRQSSLDLANAIKHGTIPDGMIARKQDNPADYGMNHSDFSIGLEFYMSGARWRCTDVGTRTIAAIKLNAPDKSWYNGPPYAVAESVIDEYDMDACSLELEE